MTFLCVTQLIKSHNWPKATIRPQSNAPCKQANWSNCNLPMFLSEKWQRSLLLLPKWKSDSGFGCGFSQIFDFGSGSERKTKNPAGVASSNPDPVPPLAYSRALDNRPVLVHVQPWEKQNTFPALLTFSLLGVYKASTYFYCTNAKLMRRKYRYNSWTTTAFSLHQWWVYIDLLTPDMLSKKFLHIRIQSLSENLWNLVSDIHPYPKTTMSI